MGPYLSAPITSKTNAFDKNKDLRYAACEMQGKDVDIQGGAKAWKMLGSTRSDSRGESRSSACSTATEVRSPPLRLRGRQVCREELRPHPSGKPQL